MSVHDCFKFISITLFKFRFPILVFSFLVIQFVRTRQFSHIRSRLKTTAISLLFSYFWGFFSLRVLAICQDFMLLIQLAVQVWRPTLQLWFEVHGIRSILYFISFLSYLSIVVWMRLFEEVLFLVFWWIALFFLHSICKNIMNGKGKKEGLGLNLSRIKKLFKTIVNLFECRQCDTSYRK